jgi:hypothetical protein
MVFLRSRVSLRRQALLVATLRVNASRAAICRARPLKARSGTFDVLCEIGWFDCDANRHLKNTARREEAAAWS